MRRCQLASTSSCNDSDRSDYERFFNAEDKIGETESGTNPTDIDTDIRGGDEADTSQIIKEDKNIVNKLCGIDARTLVFDRGGRQWSRCGQYASFIKG